MHPDDGAEAGETRIAKNSCSDSPMFCANNLSRLIVDDDIYSRSPSKQRALEIFAITEYLAEQHHSDAVIGKLRKSFLNEMTDDGALGSRNMMPARRTRISG